MPPIAKPKIILITGCSSGFGLLTAVRLSSNGHHVFATVRDRNKADFLINECAKRNGHPNILTLDVTENKSIKSAFDEIAIRHGYLDVVINNAGYGIGGFFEDLTQDEIRAQMEVNFFGVQNVTRAAIPLMRPRKQGKIINISSIAGLSASPSFSAYNASKWALEGFSESLYHEMKLFGINVCLIEPGTYRTKIFEDNARYAKNFNNPESPYFSMSQHLKKLVLNYVENTDKNPERVALVIERLIEMRNPPFRSLPDMESQLLILLRKFLPFTMYASIIQKSLYQDQFI